MSELRVPWLGLGPIQCGCKFVRRGAGDIHTHRMRPQWWKCRVNEGVEAGKEAMVSRRGHPTLPSP